MAEQMPNSGTAGDPAVGAGPGGGSGPAGSNPDNRLALSFIGRWLTRIGLAVGAVGLVLSLCVAPLATVGLALLNAGMAATVLGIAVRNHAPGRPTTGRQVSVLAMSLVLAVGVLATTVALTGIVMRRIVPADYTGRYGDQIETTVQIRDCDHERGSTRRRRYVGELKCPATWQIGNREQRGEIVVQYSEVEAVKGGTTTRQIEAYVIGDRGYSVRRVGEIESWAYWAGPPWWLLLIGIPVSLIAAILRIWLDALTLRATNPQP